MNYYINTNDKLQNVLALIRQAKIVALDTEFTRETTYYPILSLIQVAIVNLEEKKEIFLIDCLCNLDLSDFFQIIHDKEIVKILHSPLQDLQIFYQHSNLIPQNVFDTQIMGNFCDFGFNLGYSDIVEKLFDQKLDKKQQRSDWQKRPLSERQIEYAMLDVAFLQEIYEIFLDKLIESQRLNWCLEEMDLFIQKALFRKDEVIYKDFSFRGKTPIETSQIKLMALWREKWAQKINVPKRHLIKDEEIEKIVMKKNCHLEFTDEMLGEIYEIVSCDLEVIKQDDFNYFMSEKQKRIFNQAKEIVAKIAEQENIKQQFLLTNIDLKDIILKNEFDAKIANGWRGELLLLELKKLINL